MTRAWAALLFGAAALGCGRFEGEVHIDETSATATKHAIYEAKGGHLRSGEEGKTDYTLFESSGRAYAVDHAAREVLSMDIPRGTAKSGDRVSKTAITETIAGHACAVWRVELADGEKGEVCVAKDLNLGGQHVDMWFPGVHDKGLPLRGVMRDGEGKLLHELRVTSIEAKPIDSSRFELPKDYKRVDWTELARSLHR